MRARSDIKLSKAEEELRTSDLKRLRGESSDDDEVKAPRKKRKVGLKMEKEVMLVEEK